MAYSLLNTIAVSYTHLFISIYPFFCPSITFYQYSWCKYTHLSHINMCNILPKVKVEVSGRLMSEPVSGIAFDSMIDQVYPKAPFTEQKFMVRAVLPEHTFLEKIFLLHEAFAKSKNLIGVERMSRHMYDIEMCIRDRCKTPGILLYSKFSTEFLWVARSALQPVHLCI